MSIASLRAEGRCFIKHVHVSAFFVELAEAMGFFRNIFVKALKNKPPIFQQQAARPVG